MTHHNDRQHHEPRPAAWAAIRRGDNVVLHAKGFATRATVEDCTEDGLIIWIRNELNERRLIHVDDCLDVQIMDLTARKPAA